MMRYEVQKTRAWYEAAPQFSFIPHDKRYVPEVAKACQDTLEAWKDKMAFPDTEALEFYLLNHLASIVRGQFTLNEKLPDWAVKVMDCYLNTVLGQGMRLFFYLLLITTRESRHVKNRSKLREKIISSYGLEIYDFNRLLDGESSSGAVDKFFKSPPEVELGKYVKFLEFIFYEGNYSSGYGGSAWGKVAATLRSFVDGSFSLETMIDTAYTLAHNNGPIFNKGLFYKMYSSGIIRILDVQRSGQIPDFVLNMENECPSTERPPVNSAYVELLKEVQNVLGCFKGYVDWFQVEQLGSIKKYSDEKKKQVENGHGPKPYAPKHWGGKYEFKTVYAVFPNGQEVKVFNRIA